MQVSMFGRARLLQRLQYGITNPRIYHGRNQVKMDPKVTLYPFVGLRNDRSAAIILNQPNYQNKLSLEAMEEMYRFLRSYDVDEGAQHIWIENKGYNCFSDGIQYKDLLRSQKYLHRLFQLGIMMSRINKPVLGYVKGLVGGTAAYLLKYLSSPFGDKNTRMRLHDIDHAFVPVCGGSYHLSRTKGELGVYLALTGDQVNADDMVGTGFIYALLRRDHTQQQLRKIAGEYSTTGPRYFDYDTYDGATYNNRYQQEAITQEQQSDFKITTKFRKTEILVDQRKELRVVRLAQLLHNEYKVGMENIKRPFQSKAQKNIINYFEIKQSFVLPKFERDLLEPHKNQVVRSFPLLLIDKTFCHGTIEQIISALDKEGSEWSKKTVQKLRSKDPLVLKLTLRLIRQASNSTFPECLEREYRVASRLRTSKTFKDLHTHGKKSQLQLKDIQADTIAKFFQVGNPHFQLTHDVAPHALLPVKEYRRSIPDSVRFFLNRQFWNDPNHYNQEIEVARWLHNNKISHRNDSWSLDVLREKVYLRHRMMQKIEAHTRKVDRLFYNYDAEKKFRNDRANYLESVFGSQVEINMQIQQAVKDNFNRMFNQRTSDLKPTAQIYAKEQKGRLYLTLRNILVKKRLTQDVNNVRKGELGLIKFDQFGKGRYDGINPSLAGTPFQTILQSFDSEGNKIKELPVSYFDQLNEEVIPTQIQERYTTRNPKFVDILRRYENGIRQFRNQQIDLAVLQIASDYSPNVKKLLQQYSEQQIKDILYKERNFTWEHLLNEINQIEVAPQPVHIKEGSLPTFEQIYNLSSEASTFYEQIKIDVPQSMVIPAQFQQRSLKLLKLITSRLLNSLGDWQRHSLNNEIPILDNWIRQTVHLDINDFLKNDIHFIFSYFMIKDIQSIMVQLGNIASPQDSKNKLAEVGIVFQNAQDIQSAFSGYLTGLVELYNTAAQGILLKNTKLLQIHNRVKANEQIKTNSPSIDKFLIKLGKTRAQLKSKSNQSPTAFNYDTQFNLQLLSENTFDDPTLSRKKDDLVYSITQNKKLKRLVDGFQSYISRIDQMFKDINNKTDFLPESLLVADQLAQFEDLTNDIDQNQPLDIWLGRKLSQVVQTIFNYRLHAQKELSRAELVVMDQQISALLEPSQIKTMILDLLDSDIATVMQVKKDQLKSQDTTSSYDSQFSIRRLILNKGAFKRLNSLVDTIDILESRKLSQNKIDRYQATIMRLIDEVVEEAPHTKLDEHRLQKANFTNSQRLEVESATGVNFIKDELLALSRIYKEDEDLAELAKVLRT